jgi:uncharacterized protein YkwD
MAMKKQISRKAHRSHKMMSRMPKRSVRSVIKRPARRPAAQQSRSVSRGSLPKISQFKRLRYAPFAVLMLLNVLVAQWHPGQTLAATNVPQSRPHTGVLAYATTMSVSELLTSTNQQRNANSVAGLSLNTRLNSAAQAKANDMVARDYWSHNTPDGQEPWVFFDAAGYTYHKAGENLAYGFSNAANTVTGWIRLSWTWVSVLPTALTSLVPDRKRWSWPNTANREPSLPPPLRRHRRRLHPLGYHHRYLCPPLPRCLPIPQVSRTDRRPIVHPLVGMKPPIKRPLPLIRASRPVLSPPLRYRAPKC